MSEQRIKINQVNFRPGPEIRRKLEELAVKGSLNKTETIETLIDYAHRYAFQPGYIEHPLWLDELRVRTRRARASAIEPGLEKPKLKKVK